MRASTSRRVPRTVSLLLTIWLTWLPTTPTAAPVTFSGTITYQGSYSGDSLYVAALDTAGTEDVTLLGLTSIAVDSSPFTQPYSLEFDNTGVSAHLLVAAFLDVDGGGVDSLGGADVFGWYGEGAGPAGIASATSQSGLDFALPRAEIHGGIIFAPGQFEARVDVSADLTCLTEGFRPGHFAYSSGPYAIIGVYPGSYCVSASGYGTSGPLRVCYGDPTCVNPTAITMVENGVYLGVDLDFTTTSVATLPWGSVKVLYR